MVNKSEIGQDNFEKLLYWLDTEKETAARKYESIRMGLINVFYARGCHVAEEMADETIDRVTRKVHTLAESYEGEPARYFFAVAKKVFLEHNRKPKTVELPANLVQNEKDATETDTAFECLEKCLRELSADQREFIIEYYQGERSAKLERRKKLQLSLGISGEALRVRAFRVRSSLQKCVLNCMKGQ